MGTENQNPSELVLKIALRSLVPVNVLQLETFNELAKHTKLETTHAGSELFHCGDNIDRVTYLLSGQVILKDSHGTVIQNVNGGSDRARYPLAHELPREVTVQAISDISYVQIDMRELNSLMTNEYSIDHKMGNILVNDIDDVHDDDWITSALQSSLFENLPPANLQILFNHLESVPVKRGEVVINQGEIPNYYYYIRQGCCLVARKVPGKDNPQALAELKEGDGFGEEALIAYTKRNATITMLSDGILMRLSKTDFIDLIERPFLKWLTIDDIDKYTAQGACILDVRSEDEYKQSHLPKSRSIPFQHFREAMNVLDPDLNYIIYSNSGKRSAVAAFLLMQRGVNAYYLNHKLQLEENIPIEKSPNKELDHENLSPLLKLEKLKKEYKILQQRLLKEHRLRKAAESKNIENQNSVTEAHLAAEAEIAQIVNENIKLQTMQATSSDADQLTQDIIRLKAEKDAIQHELESYHSRIKDEESHLENEVKSIQELEATRIEALKEIEQIHLETTLAKQQAEQETKQLIAQSTSLSELNESRIMEEKKLAELESRKLELEQMLGKRNEVRDELDALSIHLKDTRQDMDALHQQIHNETQRLAQLKDQKSKQETIAKENTALEDRLEQLNCEARIVQSRTAEAQAKLEQQQALLTEMENKAKEYRLLHDHRAEIQTELANLETKLQVACQQVESNELDSELNTLQAKEEAVQIKANAEQVLLKAEEQAIQLKAEAEQIRLHAEEDIVRNRTEAEKQQINKEKKAARIKKEQLNARRQKIDDG